MTVIHTPDTKHSLVGAAVAVIWSNRRVTTSHARNMGISELERILRVLEPTIEFCHPGTGNALNWAIKNLPVGSQVSLYPETKEIYDALRESREIISHQWDRQVYCSNCQWLQLIETMCAGGCNVTVQSIEEDEECPFAKMRALAIRESIEAMEEGIHVRGYGYPDFLA